MSHLNHLDAYERPPDRMRGLFKRYQKCKAEDVDADANIIDMSKTPNGFDDQVQPADVSCFGDRDKAFQAFLSHPAGEHVEDKAASIPAFEVGNMSGFYILPEFLPPEIQIALLSRLLHRDLSNRNHQTNVHLHHHISYPPIQSPLSIQSFFSLDKAVTFRPKEPTVHRPITVAEFLGKKLRWMTLGGQYDWAAKQYPPGEPPPLPADIKQLLDSLFPDIDAQAAIVNFYSPGNTLGIHRDVSEYCDQGLVSISIGCDGLFVVGNQDGTDATTIRLRSGDALYMTGKSRFAWHGVAQILPNTCPHWLGEWPAVSNEPQFNYWRGWMYNKRINVNVRQMRGTRSS